MTRLLVTTRTLAYDTARIDGSGISIANSADITRIETGNDRRSCTSSYDTGHVAA